MTRSDRHILLLTRLPQDAEIMTRLLHHAGVAAMPCADMGALCEGLPESLAAVITIESLDAVGLSCLTECLAAQPPWSDVPLVLLTGRADLPELEKRLRSIANVTFLERPLRQSSFLSLVDSAVRARRRQFQVRDLLTQNQALTGERDAATRFNEDITANLTEPFYKLDNAWRFVYINPPALTWMNRPESELLGNVIWELYPQPAGNPVRGEFHAARDTQQARHFEVYSERSHVWLAVDVYPVLDGVLVFWHNIDEQRRAQQQITELNVQLRRAMTETHHRVKNNLQLIAALVDMSVLDGGDMIPIDNLKRLGLHINTLATVHDILTMATKEGHEAEDLSVKRVLEHLLPLMEQTVVGRRIHADIVEATLPTRECTSLAMIANELVSNALKHTTRDVWVTFTAQNGEGVLAVEDDGKGFPPDFDPMRAANTGLELVLNLTRHDLRGKCEFGTGQHGGLVRVMFPLA